MGSGGINLYREIKTEYKEWKLKTKEVASFRELSTSLEDVASYKGAYFDLFNGKLDVLVIKNFLIDKEIAGLLNRYERWPKELFVDKSFGRTFGPTLIDSEANLNSYFKKSKLFNSVFNESLGFDFFERFVYVMSILSGINKNAINNPHLDNDNEFAATNIKYMHPYKGSLPIHCGMQFQDLYSECSNIGYYKDARNQLSYFIVIQYPEKGGELQLYDLLYSETPKFTDPQKVRNFVSKTTASKYYRPEVGDMFFFNGGQIWHRITQVRGGDPRISLSAFTAPTPDSKGLVYWT